MTTYNYDVNSGSLFASYINAFFKLKFEASVWPK